MKQNAASDARWRFRYPHFMPMMLAGGESSRQHFHSCLSKQRSIVDNPGPHWRVQMVPRQNTALTILSIVAAGFLASCAEEGLDASADATAGTSTEASRAATTKMANGAAVNGEGSVLLPHQELARDLLKELVEIDTTDSNGDNTAAAKAMAAHLLAAGFPEEDVKVLEPRAGKGNLVARYRGRNV